MIIDTNNLPTQAAGNILRAFYLARPQTFQSVSYPIRALNSAEQKVVKNLLKSDKVLLGYISDTMIYLTQGDSIIIVDIFGLRVYYTPTSPTTNWSCYTTRRV